MAKFSEPAKKFVSTSLALEKFVSAAERRRKSFKMLTTKLSFSTQNKIPTQNQATPDQTWSKKCPKQRVDLRVSGGGAENYVISKVKDISLMA